VLRPDGELHRGEILTRGGRIQAVVPSADSDNQIDAADGYVFPGLVDVHTHGIHTESVWTGSLAEYAKIEAAYGATTFYPTFFGSPEETGQQMERHRRETDELAQVPQIGGFRLESPYIARTGAGVQGDLARINTKTTQMLMAAGGGHIRLWDISPELEGAAGLISELSQRGIVCSLAHTQATIAQARAAVDAGARLVTHFFNVFPPPEEAEAGVYPQGMVDYLLVEDRVACEIIGDGTHVFPLHVEKAFRCKPIDGLVFVTDSNFGAGLAPGKYNAPAAWGLVQVDGPNKGVRQVERDMGLAGSALTPIDSFRNVLRLFRRDLPTASRVWSKNPAQLLGLNKGEVRIGRDADLIILNRDLDLCYTIVAGEVVYHRPLS
jgi:N-acetylglucosamine-6-phosphate deacetylase